jgi:hypothetical protein
MADADKSLDILIRLRAEVDGAIKATQATGELKEELKGAGEEAKDATAKSKPFTGHLGEVKKAVRELGKEFPVAGFALKAFLNPIGAALTIAIGFFAKAKSAIDDMNKSSEEMISLAQNPTFAAGIAAHAAALDKAKQSAQDYRVKIEALMAPVKSFGDFINSLLGTMTAGNQAQQNLAEAQYNFEKARLDEAHKRKLVSEEQYQLALATMEQARNDARLKAQEDFENKQVALRRAAVEEMKKIQVELDAIVAGRQKQAEASAAKAETDAANLDALKAELKDLTKLEEDRRKKVEDYGNFDYAKSSFEKGLGGRGANLYREYAEAHDAVEAQRRAIAQQAGQVGRDKVAAGADARSLGNVQDQALKNAGDTTAMIKALADLTEQLKVTREASRGAAGFASAQAGLPVAQNGTIASMNSNMGTAFQILEQIKRDQVEFAAQLKRLLNGR